MSLIKKLFGGTKKKSSDELKAEVFRKATANWNANSELEEAEASVMKSSGSIYEDIDAVKKKNIRTVLLALVERGETGILSTSISDKADMSKHDTSNALAYLTENKYAESVNSPSGVKFYITAAGKKFCLSREFNAEA